MRESSSEGKKQGVSDTRNPIGTPQRSARRASNSGYFSALYFELKECRREGIIESSAASADDY
jgi:hypothetical protein